MSVELKVTELLHHADLESTNPSVWGLDFEERAQRIDFSVCNGLYFTASDSALTKK